MGVATDIKLFRDKVDADAWRVEYFDDDDGGCYVAIFAGPAAERRARDLVGKLDVLAVACDKCGRSGRYRVATLAERIGSDGKLTDWLYSLTADCPRKQSPGLSDPCGARCPDLPKVM